MTRPPGAGPYRPGGIDPLTVFWAVLAVMLVLLFCC